MKLQKRLGLLIVAGATLLLPGFVKSNPEKEKYECPTDLTPIANELILAELYGWHIPHHETACPQLAKDLKFIRFQNIAGSDVQGPFPEPNLIMKPTDKYTIDNITQVEPMRYKVEFSLLTGAATLKDSFVMRVNSGAMRESMGCAHLLDGPNNIFVYEGCYNANAIREVQGLSEKVIKPKSK